MTGSYSSSPQLNKQIWPDWIWRMNSRLLLPLSSCCGLNIPADGSEWMWDLLIHMAALVVSHRKHTCPPHLPSPFLSLPGVQLILLECDKTLWIIEKLSVQCAGSLALLAVIICEEAARNAHSFNRQPATSNNPADLFPPCRLKWLLESVPVFVLAVVVWWWLEFSAVGNFEPYNAPGQK